MTHAQFLILARTVAALTFALSSLSKARDLDAFHATLRDLRLMGDRPARVLAPLVMLCELAVVLASAAGPVWIGLGGATALLAIYTGVLSWARAHGSTIGCHCFGKKPQPLSWYDVVRNVLLLVPVGAGVAIALGGPTPALHGYGSALAVPAGAAVVLLALNLGLVVEALRRPLPVQETA